jgi:hypothetical protein
VTAGHDSVQVLFANEAAAMPRQQADEEFLLQRAKMVCLDQAKVVVDAIRYRNRLAVDHSAKRAHVFMEWRPNEPNSVQPL